MPNNDCTSYRASVVSVPDLITPSVSIITTRQPVVRFAQNAPVMPASQHIEWFSSKRMSSSPETQHFRDLSVHGKARRVAETVARHSRATWQWCFSDKTRQQDRDRQSFISGSSSGITASEILASSARQKGPSEKKCVAAKYAELVTLPQEECVLTSDEGNKDPLTGISLSSQLPEICEKILGNIAMAMRQDLELFFDPFLSSDIKNDGETRKKILNAFSHFFSSESDRKFNFIEKNICSWEVSPFIKQDMLKRLHDLREGLTDNNTNYYNSPASRVNEKDFDVWDVLSNAANKELAYVLWKAGPTKQQFSHYLALSEAANLVQAAHQLPAGLATLLSGDGDNHLNDVTRKIKNKRVVKMINMMVFDFAKICRKIWHPLYQYDGLFSHIYRSDIHGMKKFFYYHGDINVVADKFGDTIPAIIKERTNRAIVERFYRRVSIANLYRATIDNSPLVLTRSDVNADTIRLFNIQDGGVREDVIKKGLSIKRGERLKIFFDNMFIAPLIVGDEFPLESVSLQSIPFKERGLSLEKIGRQFIDNEKISDQQLKAIAIFSNRFLREITSTGELYPYIEWMLAFEGDVLASFMSTWKNLPVDNYDSWFMVDKLQVIAQKLHGHKSFGENVMTLLENSLKLCPGEDLTVDELAWLLTLPYDGMLKIIRIADQITAMSGVADNHYDPLNEWRGFVIYATSGEDLRRRLDERQRLRQQNAPLRDLSVLEPANSA
ncbi:hypothetical protein SC171_04380 [Pantoea cypripedii]|uniref:hypothetical protein n=1 Tax=Pantoea cypripedii TaxID=55209 RepID=UPI002FC8CF9E